MPMIKLYLGDCLKIIPQIESNSIDLSFSDIPFNINLQKRLKTRNKGFNGISYSDKLSDEDYYNLIKVWVNENYRLLKLEGTLVIMTGWTNLNLIYKAIDTTNFYLLNHCIIKYAFGIYTKKRFVTSHYHLLFLTKSNKKWVFNKQKKYDEDVWIMNRDFNAKKLGHPCPTTLEWVEKIILTSSNENDLVLDCFLGSGTTAVACKKLNRRCIGIEKEEKYLEITKQRLKEIG